MQQPPVPPRIAIANADAIVSELVALYLQSHGYPTVIADADTNDGIAHLAQGCDALLVDPSSPCLSSQDDIHALIARLAPMPVILFASQARTGMIDDALHHGARGFVPRSVGARTLLNALAFVLAGETYIPSSYLDRSAPQGRAGVTFSPKEIDVLLHLRKGRTNKEIAATLGLSLVSVKMNVRAICYKLSAKNRTEAALLATRIPLE